jgi:protein TonB
MSAMASKPSRKVFFFPRRAKHGRHTRWQANLARLDARLAELERRYGARDRMTSAFTLSARMRTALFASLAIHVAILYGIGFTLPGKLRPDQDKHALEVVLVNAKSKTQPVIADARAQHNLDGGGNTDEKRRAQSPLPVMPEQKADAEVKLALRRVEQLEREARQVVTQAQSRTPIETAPPAKAAPVAEADSQAQPSASDIMQRSMELARLEAKISRDWDAYQQRPRRRFIGSRTQEYRFARYVEDWRQKIERIGDLNYPQGAREQRLHGRLVVTVAIRADGTVEAVDINTSSRHKILDEAARRIVQLAAPFSAFPADIAKDVDILHITRTWTFTTGERFVSE